VNALLVAGTDTDAGKTVVMSALAAYWQTYWSTKRLGIFKPVQSGVGDCERYSQLFGLDPAEVTPVRFEAALAPPIAAEREGSKVAVEHAWQAFEQLRQSRDFILVEGLGGLGSPVTRETTVADLAWDWRLPTVLVVPVRLGAIGQAVANVALARQSKIHLKGIILNCAFPQRDQDIADFAPVKLIESLTNIPVLGIFPHVSSLMDITQLAEAASQIDLERLFPGNLWRFPEQVAS
jgi:dethiobiotin synthetase